MVLFLISCRELDWGSTAKIENCCIICYYRHFIIVNMTIIDRKNYCLLIVYCVRTHLAKMGNIS